MRLSLCIITHNEEKNVHIPLDSAYDIADEVVVIDAASTDKTVQIVKKYGDKIRLFEVDNPKNFLTNKERAIEKAKGEWILQLDADEAVSPELKEEIKNVLEANEILSRGQLVRSSLSQTTDSRKISPASTSIINGYLIPRKNWFLGRFLMKGGVYPDYVLRLYRREGAHFELKNVHENVKVKGEVGTLKNAIEHFADPDFERYLMRWNRYTSFDAGLLAKEKTKLGFLDFINYFFIKPKIWFFKTYFRHKGFMDGFPGFVFSLFSAIRFWAIYVKAWRIMKDIKHRS